MIAIPPGTPVGGQALPSGEPCRPTGASTTEAPSPSGRPTTTPTGTAPTNEAVARLTDQGWERVRPLLPPHPPPAGSAGRDHRTTLEGVLWVLNNGASWRDLPEEEFGPWETVYGRYRRWRKEGRWQQVVETLLANETR